MLLLGFIQHIIISYTLPIILVKEKDGMWRMCIDYRCLNDCTIKDKFSFTIIEDLLEELHDSIIFSKLDLHAGYH